MLEINTIDFLKKLKNNNSREWLDDHRKLYDEAKLNFEQFVSVLLQDFCVIDKRYAELKPKDCIFRLNRDIRFSKDKSPYKTNFGAAFSPGGKKSVEAGLYVHIEPEQSFVAGGIWMPEAELLRKIRQEIDYNWVAFQNIISEKKFGTTFGALDNTNSLKNPPKGYQIENPAIEILKLKNFVATHRIEDKELTSKRLSKSILEDHQIIKPFLTFLNTAIID